MMNSQIMKKMRINENERIELLMYFRISKFVEIGAGIDYISLKMIKGEKYRKKIIDAESCRCRNTHSHNGSFHLRFFLWLTGVPIFFDFWRIRMSQRNSSSERFL